LYKVNSSPSSTNMDNFPIYSNDGHICVTSSDRYYMSKVEDNPSITYYLKSIQLVKIVIINAINNLVEN